MNSIRLIFIVIALVLFILSGLGVGGRYNLQSWGLAFLTASFIA